MAGAATQSAQHAMKAVGAHSVAEIESAVKGAKCAVPKPPGEVTTAYFATISGAAMASGVSHHGKGYNPGYRGNGHRFESAPFGSAESPEYNP